MTQALLAYCNGEIISPSKITFNHTNRGFLYGDGFFETLFYTNNTIPLWKYHQERINKAFQAYDFSPLKHPILDDIKKIAQHSSLNTLRLKVIFWRKDGGLFEPENTSCNYIILAFSISSDRSLEIDNLIPMKKGLNHHTSMSPFKSLSASKYVEAGLFKKRQQASEIVILDTNDNISETLYCNVFWEKDGIIYTPDVLTGCVEGTMRNAVIDYLKEKVSLKIERSNISNLNEAQSIFLTNALGVYHVNAYQNKKLTTNPMAKELHQELLGKYI